MFLIYIHVIILHILIFHTVCTYMSKSVSDLMPLFVWMQPSFAIGIVMIMMKNCCES